MRTALIVLLLALVALMIFNPTMDDFKAFVTSRSEQAMLERTGDGALGEALSGAGATLAGSLVQRVTDRHNYFLFSTYTIDFDGDAGDGSAWRFVGVAGQFVEIDRPNDGP